ncbi:DUF6270 domain-containing protein [Teichococcus aestuarii]|uniref:DUF6270 domain-containing protein n=1 Tax=Teichococcus aestuarii TaxID=568898 RepID=UPI0036176707
MFDPSNLINEASLAPSVGLLGACVSLDTCLALFPAAKKYRYFLRINTVSLMSPGGNPIDLSHIITDPKELLTFSNDANKSFDMNTLLNEDFVLIDFFRDTYSVVQLQDGRYITAGLQWWQYKLENHLPVSAIIKPTDPAYPDFWFEAFQRFADAANKTSTTWLISPIHLVTTLRDGWDDEPPAQPTGVHNRRSVMLSHMQRIALAALRRSCILPLPTEWLQMDRDHRYGAAPYHYPSAFFQAMRDTAALNPGSIQVFMGGAAERERAILHELEAWKNRAAEF